MKYLIFFDATLGNFTHIIPNLIYLKKKNINFTILVLNSDVYELSKFFKISKNVIYLTKKKNLLLRYISIFKAIYFLNKKKFDVFVNLSLNNHWKNIIFNKIIKTKKKYSFLIDLDNQKNRSINFFKYKHKKSEAQNYFEFFQDVFKKKFEIKLIQNRKNKKKIIGIHTGSSKSLSYKRWDKSKFLILIKRLVELNFSVILLGKGSEEEEINSYLFNKIKSGNLYNFTNKLNMKKLIFQLKSCRLILSNDSGIMQLSNLLGISTIGLFGPTSEVKNYPNSKNFHPIRLFSKTYCNKYTNEICKKCSLNQKFKLQPKCLHSINVDFVLKKTFKLLHIK